MWKGCNVEKGTPPFQNHKTGTRPEIPIFRYRLPTMKMPIGAAMFPQETPGNADVFLLPQPAV